MASRIFPRTAEGVEQEESRKCSISQFFGAHLSGYIQKANNIVHSTVGKLYLFSRVN